MLKNFTLEYWIDDGWYVGRLREVPWVFSQGEAIEELKENIRDAYRMVKDPACCLSRCKEKAYRRINENVQRVDRRG